MSRRKAREIALKVLFQVDVGKADPEEALRMTLAGESLSEEAAGFCSDLVRGTVRNQRDIDTQIGDLAQEWTLVRMPALDRNLLRLSIYEMEYFPETPAGIIINEAVELAKMYSTSESGKFINGILGNLIRKLEPGVKG